MRTVYSTMVVVVVCIFLVLLHQTHEVAHSKWGQLLSSGWLLVQNDLG